MTPNTTLNHSAANINNATHISHVAQFASTASDNVYLTQQLLHQRQQQLQQFLTQYNLSATALPPSSASSASASTLLSQLMMNQTTTSLPSSTAASAAALKEQLHQQQQRLRRLQWQHEQQKAYVNALVNVTVQVIASIWPNSLAIHQSSQDKSSTKIADLTTFLHHILKHSRTTHSTLQLAIFYLFRIRSRFLYLFQQQSQHDQSSSNSDVQQDVYITCGRRMFLAALISAHKFLQDKTYKNSAWSKVSGLSVKEINHAEMVFLQLLEYRLMVKKEVYNQWMSMLQAHLMKQMKASSTSTTSSSTPATTMSNTFNINGNVMMEMNNTDKCAATLSTAVSATHTATSTLPSPPMDDVYSTGAAMMRLQGESLRKAQQSLPSPPLDESSSSRKRRIADSSDQDRTTKRQCH